MTAESEKLLPKIPRGGNESQPDWKQISRRFSIIRNTDPPIHPASHSSQLLPYHTFGKIKYEAIGLPFDQDGFYTPDREEMKKLRGIAAAQGPEIVDFR